MSTPRTRRILRRLAISLAAVLGGVLVVGGILVAWKPWAPKIVVSDPGPTGRRIALTGGLIANYFSPAGSTAAAANTRAPAILLIGGSEGGIGATVQRTALDLQKHGYAVLALSYWGAPGQSPRMENLPLESFDTALEWLKTQREVDPTRLAMMGGSKGGEATELVATRRTDLKAVVAYVPSSVVWQGIDQAEVWRMASMGSTWSAGGQSVPYLPYRSGFGGERRALFENSLTALPEHPDAVIPVEKARAPQLLVCGEKDTMWPSCPMSDAIRDRAAQRGGPPVTVLRFPDAGHLLIGAPIAADDPGYQQLGDFGGTPGANQGALVNGWPKVVAFLRDHLGTVTR